MRGTWLTQILIIPFGFGRPMLGTQLRALIRPHARTGLGTSFEMKSSRRDLRLKLAGKDLGRGGFPVLLRDRGLRARGRFARRHHFDGCEHSPFDSSDHRAARAYGGHRYETVLLQQTIDQLPLAAPQHLLRQRKEVTKCPHQRGALNEVRLQISRPNWRFQLNNAASQFVDPHQLPAWERC